MSFESKYGNIIPAQPDWYLVRVVKAKKVTLPVTVTISAIVAWAEIDDGVLIPLILNKPLDRIEEIEDQSRTEIVVPPGGDLRFQVKTLFSDDVQIDVKGWKRDFALQRGWISDDGMG